MDIAVEGVADFRHPPQRCVDSELPAVALGDPLGSEARQMTFHQGAASTRSDIQKMRSPP
jgi:hypothetical protein